MYTDRDLVVAVRYSTPQGSSVVQDAPVTHQRLDSIRNRVDSITYLEIGPVPARSFQAQNVSTLFQRDMPVLRDLVLRATHGSDCESAVGYVPKPIIHWQNLPSLQSLVLDGVGLPSGDRLSHGLRRLELRNYPGDHWQSEFPELLAALSCCVALEELRIHRYLQIANLDSYKSVVVVLPNLLRLFIHDSPAHISHLLPFLHLPRIVDLTLSAYFHKYKIHGGRVVPTLASIMPPRYHAQDIASSLPVHVHLTVDSKNVFAKGITACGRYISLEGSANLSDPATRVQTYARTIESLGNIFNIASVTNLVIKGDFSTSFSDTGRYVYNTAVASAEPPRSNGTVYFVPHVSHAQSVSVSSARPLTPNWTTVLSHLASLRSLCIEDTGTGTPPEAFAAALARTGTQPVCCPHLEELCLQGVVFDKPFFSRLAQSLSGRRRRTPLKRLTVIMRKESPWSMVDAVAKMFPRLVDTLEVRLAEVCE